MALHSIYSLARFAVYQYVTVVDMDLYNSTLSYMQAAMLRSAAAAPPVIGPNPSSSTSTVVATVIRATLPMKYGKGSVATDLTVDGGGLTVVKGVLSLLQKEVVTITWISRLQYGSTEVYAGQSWLSATLDGKPILAFIPKQGVFAIQDRIFLLLRLFDVAERDSFGLPTTTIPISFSPAERIVKVDSSKLQDVVVLWPSFRAERGQTVVYRFVPMD